MMRARFLIAGLLLAAAFVMPQQAVAAPITYYQVTFDTSLLPASTFALDVQLNDGSGTGDGTSQATLTNFVFGSGSPSGLTSMTGGVSGDVVGGVTLTDTSFFNQFFQQFIAGNLLSFRLGLALDGPTDTPDLFTLAILDPDGFEIPTTGPFGLEFISADTSTPAPGGYRSTSTAYTLGAPTITPEVSHVPEPSSALLLGAGVLGFLGYRRRRAQQAA